MSFDDDVDALKASLAEERGGAERARKCAALKAVCDVIVSRMATRRVEFELDADLEGDDEPAILLVHVATGEELGAVFADDDGVSFESEDDDYFPDIPAMSDHRAFAEALSRAFKVGLPVYELDVESDGA